MAKVPPTIFVCTKSMGFWSDEKKEKEKKSQKSEQNKGFSEKVRKSQKN